VRTGGCAGAILQVIEQALKNLNADFRVVRSLLTVWSSAGSPRRSAWTFAIECITVVLCLPLKIPPNLGKRGVGHLLSQVHGNLAGHHDCTSAAVLSQLIDRQVEQMSYGPWIDLIVFSRTCWPGAFIWEPIINCHGAGIRNFLRLISSKAR
jgi:hypothetical protein